MTSVKILGIAFGSGCSRLAVYRNGKVETVCDEDGARFTPSWVSFYNKRIYFGQAAKDLSFINPYNTLFDIEKLLCVNYSDHQLQQDIDNWPFEVVNRGGNPRLQVNFKGETKEYYPEDILVMILSNIIEQAEKHLGEKVDDAVISVPGCFDTLKRQATDYLGTVAGLNVLRIISESTATALAYGLKSSTQKDKLILVFDLGDDSLNVSVVEISNNGIMVKSTAENTDLSTQCFGDELLKHCLSMIDNGVTFSSDLKSRLVDECKKAIVRLSEQDKAEITINELPNGLSFQLEISRELFILLCNPLFEKARGTIGRALKYANISKSEIDEIIMAGGSKIIQGIRLLLSELFCGKPLRGGVNPDEAIAHGAAILGSLIKGGTYDRSAKIKYVDVVPLSIGVKTSYGQMYTIIPRNSRIPVKKIVKMYTIEDYQEKIEVVAYEGERHVAVYNHLLGSITAENIKQAKRGDTCYLMTFSISKNRILDMIIEEESIGELAKSSINLVSKRLPEKTIELMVRDSITNYEKDLTSTERINSLDELEYLVYTLRRVTEEVALSTEDAHRLLSLSHSELDWIMNSKHTTKETYDKRILDLTLAARPIIDNIIPEQKIKHERFYKHFE